MEEQEKKRLFMLLDMLQKAPDMSFYVNKGPTGGLLGCATWSMYLTELAFKFKSTASVAQINKIKELTEAYKLVVQDLNEAYMLYLLYCNARKKWHDQVVENEMLNREIKGLREDIEKLQKIINFGA